ncbi:hypothetical protein M9458_025301, partial [Cirrhinus mrigala]
MGAATWHSRCPNHTGLPSILQPVVRPCIPSARSVPRAGVQACRDADAFATGWGAMSNGQASVK